MRRLPSLFPACVAENHLRLDLDIKTQEQLESNSWYVLNEAFSLPVFQAEDVADYAPTQYIAEAFRAAGHGGIMYTSQVGDGKNIALFDVQAAERKKTR